jgi:hypothetical protein
MRDHKVSLDFGAFRPSPEVSPQATTSMPAGKSARIEMQKARLTAGFVAGEIPPGPARMSAAETLAGPGFRSTHGTRVTHAGYL